MNLTDYNNKPTNPWILTGSMFYSMQLYTTIGYGSPTPKTNKGRGFTIFYCIVGIPSFLWYIRSVGKYLSKTMKKMYKKLRNSPVGKLPFLKTIMSAVDKFENGGVSEEEETKKPLPIIVAVIMIVFWIVLSAYLFSEWEGTWDFWSAIYFCFISNATVGLGDMLFTSSHMIPVNSVFILVGLALLSMTFDLVTNKVSTLVHKKSADVPAQLTYFAATNQKNYQPGFQDMLKKWMARQVFETVVLPEILESDDESDSDDESEFMSQEQEAFRRLVESMPEYSSGDFNNCIFLEFVKHRKLPRFFKNTMTNQTTIACQTGEQDDRADNDTLFPDDEYFKSDSHNIFSQYDHESINSLFDDIPLD
ncbi:hypothetical protein GCK72_022309 [Caenorhabditis remanei]|uniref:Potassium channel domain-containing protein n=1 Tax=Caenorhabditis remanei TaxID=31234 RepID=A0A6A5FTH0_CAERE|nr:hypothetical protein GCK72_022309 [Caenorhabditis remanei]KAF1745862.1 hypothetical protein GCK72_022309 [Caenorhabditis remanei]